MEKQKFNVSGMSCSACSARVEKVVGALDGVKSVSVSLLTNSMLVEYDSPLTAKDICKAAAEAGYKAAIASDKSEKKDKMNPILVMVIRLAISIALLLPLMYVSMGVVMWDWPLSFKDDPMAIAIVVEHIFDSAELPDDAIEPRIERFQFFVASGRVLLMSAARATSRTLLFFVVFHCVPRIPYGGILSINPHSAIVNEISEFFDK